MTCFVFLDKTIGCLCYKFSDDVMRHLICWWETTPHLYFEEKWQVNSLINLWMIWQYFPCLSCDLLSLLLIGSNSSSLFNEKGHVIILWNQSYHGDFILKSTLLREWMICFYCILVIFCITIHFSLLSINFV